MASDLTPAWLPVNEPEEAPDERLREAGVWPDQSAMHGVLLDQIKDAYAEGIADTLDRIRVRAAEMLPEVARFTLDEIEALAAADREAPDEAGRICCRGMGADGGCNICAAEATR